MDLCEKSWFYDAQYLISTAFVSVYTAFVSVISHNGVDIDRDPVHYGVVYEYVYANDVLFYITQGFNPYGNNVYSKMYYSIIYKNSIRIVITNVII